MDALEDGGLSPEAIDAAFGEIRKHDLDWTAGRCFAYVFSAGEDVGAVAKRAYTAFMTENALDPTSFPSLVRMENEVVQIAIELAHGDAAVGNFTSGGTESILLAVKTARDHGRAERGIERPNLVVADSVHPAFHKAAHYFGLDVTSVPVRRDFRADPEAMAAAIDENTVLVVGSAPSYAQGVIDPIPELAAAAAKRGTLMHVDACVGGFFLPFLEQAGHTVAPFDFRVPGVTSISLDLHKHGYCPKGASVVLYADPDLRRHQLFAHTRWAGYGITNATVQSSRGGASVAAAWAVLRYIGAERYRNLQTEVRSCVVALREGIDAIDGLRVLGEPEGSLLAFSSDSLDVFSLVDAMRERKWYIQPQFGHDHVPRSVHLTVTPINVPHQDAFLTELSECVDVLQESSVQASPAADPMAAMAAAFVSGQLSIPDAVSAIGADPARTAGDSAAINRVLDALPAEHAEAVLREYFHQMYASP
ncbi:MAG: aspartate aminotransferase family protein [Nannocystaceae bacterium]|nr:aspartate aminotransferase family protein [Nannocystaceae bacterium]